MDLEQFHLEYRRALEYATAQHADQTRKYSELPYLVHLVRVANLLLIHHPLHDDPEARLGLLQVALLHDTIEDTAATCEEIAEQFGPEVARDVRSLSKPGARTEVDAELERRLSAATRRARCVKLADRYDNLLDARSDFRPEKLARYAESSRVILRVCGAASPALAAELQALIEGVESRL